VQVSPDCPTSLTDDLSFPIITPRLFE